MGNRSKSDQKAIPKSFNKKRLLPRGVWMAPKGRGHHRKASHSAPAFDSRTALGGGIKGVWTGGIPGVSGGAPCTIGSPQGASAGPRGGPPGRPSRPAPPGVLGSGPSFAPCIEIIFFRHKHFFQKYVLSRRGEHAVKFRITFRVGGCWRRPPVLLYLFPF